MSTQPQTDDDYDDNDAQEPEAEPGQEEIPAGIHNVRGVEGSDQQGFASTGTEQVSIEVEFVDLGGRRATSILYFSEAAEVDSVKKLKALGWDGGDALTGIGKNIVRASVKYETYEGKRRMRVDIFSGGRFEMKNQMDDKEKRGFFARLNEVAKREGTPKAAGSAPAGKGYPADWDKNKKPPSTPAARAPRVNL